MYWRSEEKNRKSQTDERQSTVDSTIDYVYYKNPRPVENSYSPNLALT